MPALASLAGACSVAAGLWGFGTVWSVLAELSSQVPDAWACDGPTLGLLGDPCAVVDAMARIRSTFGALYGSALVVPTVWASVFYTRAGRWPWAAVAYGVGGALLIACSLGWWATGAMSALAHNRVLWVQASGSDGDLATLDVLWTCASLVLRDPPVVFAVGSMVCAWILGTLALRPAR